MLDVLYDGHRITQDDLAALTKQGRGTFTTTDPDTENDLHATRAFDTLAARHVLGGVPGVAEGEGRRDDVEAWGTLHP